MVSQTTVREALLCLDAVPVLSARNLATEREGDRLGLLINKAACLREGCGAAESGVNVVAESAR